MATKNKEQVTGEPDKKKHPGGAPAFYKSPEELEAKCAEYFEYIKGEYTEKRRKVSGAFAMVKVYAREPEPKCITGLALYLGFDSRQSLYDYEKKEEFSYIVKRARLIVENGYERGLHSGGPVAGPIFALKNMGWSDRQLFEHSGNADNPAPVLIHYSGEHKVVFEDYSEKK